VRASPAPRGRKVGELVGHLPVYGAMLVLLVYGSDPRLRHAVSSLWPFGRRPVDAIRGALEPRPVSVTATGARAPQ
jgi:hypothetical protein